MRKARHILALAAVLLAPGAPPVFAAAGATGDTAAATVEDQHLGSDIVEIYETALANLEQICGDYRRIKAIQQAKELDIPYDEAYRNISSVMPLLDPVDKPLLRRAIRDPNDIATHKHAVEKVESQIETMIDLAAKLLEEIEVIQVKLLDGGAMMKNRDPTLEEIVQKPEYDPNEIIEIGQMREGSPGFAQLEELAKDDEGKQFKDLTPLMHQLMPDIKDLTKEAQDGEAKPRDLFRSSDSPGALMRITDPEVARTFGRKIGDGGAPVEWLFINSWYTIGPFPNPMRINIHTKFPPETVVDLAATYVGKDGQRLRWEWVQSGEPMVQPSVPDQYGVYYAYTEISCDRPMDLWVAVGSDDKANVWLNGMPIWISSDRLKGWRVNEGFRKVTFRRGVNKVLYRIENGWLNIGFSMGIRVAP